jgi:dihydroorotase
MSANPARIIALNADRGKIAEGLRADLVIVDTGASWNVDPRRYKSRGRCSPFAGTTLKGKVLMTVNAGGIIFDGR